MAATLLQFIGTVGLGLVGIAILAGFVIIAIGTWLTITSYR